MAATTIFAQPGDTEAPISVALREIAKGIAAARDAMTFVTDPQVLGDSLCEIVGLGTELDSLRIDLVTQCQANGVPDTIGVRTMGQYVGARTNTSTKDTNADLRLAKWLQGFPIFAAALQRRDMTARHLEFLRTKLDNDRTGSLLKDDQQFFADLARDVDFKQFEYGCAYWQVMIDPDGKEPIDQLESVGVSITVGTGGRVKVTIDSDAASGSAFVKMIEHETNKIHKQDKTDGIERTTRQRKHAAVFALMERGFGREDGTHPTPLFNIVMSQTVAEWTVERFQNPDADCGQVPVHPLDIDGRCEFIDGQPVHPLLVAAVLGLHRLDTPTLRRYVLTAENQIVDYSYSARVPPEHVRTASHIEHRGRCTMPGCVVPHSWLHIDHIEPHSKGGQTRLRNLEPKCGPDNLAKGATTGHTPAKHKPPPPWYQRPQTSHRQDGKQNRPNPQDDDPDEH